MRVILMTEKGVSLKEVVHADKDNGLNLVTADGYKVHLANTEKAKEAFKMLAERDVCDLSREELDITEDIKEADFEDGDFEDGDFDDVDFDSLEDELED